MPIEPLETIDIDPKLKPKMKAFVDLLVADESLPQWKAYSMVYGNENKRSCESGASRLMKKAVVCSYKAAISSKLAEAAELDRPWVVARLKEISDRSMSAVPVLDKMGNETGIYTFDPANAIKSTELIGKDIGMFSKDKDNSDGLTVNLSINLGNGKVIESKPDKPAIDVEVIEDQPVSEYAEGRDMLEQLGIGKTGTDQG